MTDIVPRSVWGADNVQLDPMPKVPVDTVFLHHTATTPTLDGAKDMRNIESGEQAQGYTTIAYHECGHPDGKVYEGRGVKHLGAATKAWNAKSLAYALIGNYETLMPGTVQLEQCAQRLAQWVRDGAATKDFVLRAHSDVFPTACCGKNLKPHIPGIRQRVNDILAGNPAPTPGGKLVSKSKVFEAKVKTDGNGDGYVDVYHGEPGNPLGSFATANGGISNGKYPAYTPLFWCAGREGTHVRVTVVKCQANAEFTFKLHCDW